MERRDIFLPGGKLFQIIAGSKQARRNIMFFGFRGQQHYAVGRKALSDGNAVNSSGNETELIHRCGWWMTSAFRLE